MPIPKEKKMEFFKRIEASLLEITTPIEGDFVEYETGKFARISVDHRDGRFQLSNSVGKEDFVELLLKT